MLPCLWYVLAALLSLSLSFYGKEEKKTTGMLFDWKFRDFGLELIEADFRFDFSFAHLFACLIFHSCSTVWKNINQPFDSISLLLKSLEKPLEALF